MDDEMALYRECCSPNKTIMVNKVTFVFFGGVIAPMSPPGSAPGFVVYLYIIERSNQLRVLLLESYLQTKW